MQAFRKFGGRVGALFVSALAIGGALTVASGTSATADVILSPPVFSVPGGEKSAPISLTITSANAGATVRYTLDGTDPDASDPAATGPIALSATKSVRARAFLGADTSPIVTRTYVFGVDHTMPIISVSADPAIFTNPVDGLFVKIYEDIEKDVNVEMYDTDGTLAFSQMVETELQGTSSVTYDQKSLAFKAKASLGNEWFDYPIWGPNGPLPKYKSFTVRNSGQDWNYSMFRDPLVGSLVRDVQDLNGIIDDSNLDNLAYRPAAVYINGNYYGLMGLVERPDARYIDAHYGLKANEIDLLEKMDDVTEGDLIAWNALYAFANGNDLTDPAKYTQIGTMLDLDHYLDYVVFQHYIDNTDWPDNNDRHWRSRKDNGPFRFITKDLDFSFGLRTLGKEWNSGDATGNSLNRMIVGTGWNSPNPNNVIVLFKKLIQNEQFRHEYVNRMADQINVNYAPARVTSRIDAYSNEVRVERKRHLNLYAGGWEGNAIAAENSMKAFATNRPALMRQFVVDEFADITGTTNTSITATPLAGGKVEFSTLNLEGATLPFNGVFFAGSKIPLKATPKPGYTFKQWNVTGGTVANATAAETTVILSGNGTVTAEFEQGVVTADPITISEIFYNAPVGPDPGDYIELSNPTAAAVAVGGWYIVDSGTVPFTLPAGTIIPAGGRIVVAEDPARVATVFPGTTALGPMGFGLGGGGELIRLHNPAGTVIDEVTYDDVAPWPLAADGLGASLQLTDLALDNALGTSWIATWGTPGAANITGAGTAQTVTIDPITDKTVLSPAFPVTATASSGLPARLVLVSGPATIAGNTITLSGSAGTVRIAAFQEGDSTFAPAPEAIVTFNVVGTAPAGALVINEIMYSAPDAANPGDWIEIRNTSNAAVNMTGMALADSSNLWPIPSGTTIPANGYIVFAEDATLFASQYPGVTIAGAYGFGFAGGGEIVRLVDQGGTSDMDSLTYDDVAPWPGNARGTGNTIQLTDPTLDNSIGTNWVGAAPTPGAANNVPTLTPQTITFPSITDKLGTDAPFALEATASSGLAVSYRVVSGPATVSGSTVTLTGTGGTVTIEATQVGDTTYAAATPVQRSFTVTGPPPPDALVINEINYSSLATADAGDWVELHNRTNAAVSLDGLSLVDSGTTPFAFPTGISIPAGGYLVVAEDLVKYAAIYPTVTNVIGSFGFGLAAGGEIVSLKQGGADLDVVTFDDIAPWPTNAKATGNTIQLISATSDNGLGASWVGNTPTPGVVNNTTVAQSQTITFGPLSNKVTTDAPFALSATASSGLPVSYTVVSGPATISDSTVTLAGTAGTVIIEATQLGNASFLPAAAVEQTFTVTAPPKTDQTITFPTITDKASTAAPFALAATASSGLTVSYAIVSGPATVSGNTVTLSGAAGTVIIAASQEGNDTFNAAPTVQRSFAVLTDIPTTPPTGYCSASATKPWEQWIGGITLGTINSTSGKSNYSNFTAQSTNLAAGQVAPITLKTAHSYFTWPAFYAVWIDVNRNAIFDANEVVYQGVQAKPANGTALVNLTGNLTVPGSVLPGPTRMRVIMQRNTAVAASCGVIEFGEVEDYLVNLAGSAGPVLTVNSSPANQSLTTAIGSTTAVANWSAPTATTTCVGGAVNVVQTAGPVSGSAIPVGTTTVTYSISDNCTNTATREFTITVTQGVATLTVLSSPANQSLTTAPASTTVVASWAAPTASTTCPGGAVNVVQSAGPVSGSAIPVGTTTVTYSISDNCTNTATRTFTITVTAGVVNTSYCAATSGFPWHEWLSTVQFGSMTKTSSKNAYSNFTSDIATMTKGGTVAYTLTTSFSYFAPDEYLRVWVDFDGNKTFDANELVVDRVLANIADGTANAPLSGTFVVPATANSGDTRIRVVLSRDPNPASCGTVAFGEVEDYTARLS